MDYIVRIEWQKRGYPHAHILLWTDVPNVTGKRRPEKDAADEEEEQEAEVDWSDEEVRARFVPTCAEELSDKYISTKSAHRWMHDARCDPEHRAAMAKLAALTEHSCGPYCGKYTLGACRFGFPRAPEKQTRWRTPQEQFSSRWKSSMAARRHEDDGFVGQYNEAILRFWRASMDLQVVCELNCASKYILGYCFKSEEDLMAKKRVDNILQSYLQDAGRVDLTTNEVYKAALAATQGRTTSTFEGRALHLGLFAGVLLQGQRVASGRTARYMDLVGAPGRGRGSLARPGCIQGQTTRGRGMHTSSAPVVPTAAAAFCGCRSHGAG